MRRPLALPRLPSVAGALVTTLLLSSGARADLPAPAPPPPTPRAARAPVPLDGIAAIVDDVTIFRSDVTARARRFEATLSKDPVKRRAELAELWRTLVSRMIDDVLMAKDATRLQLEASDAEVSAGIAAVAQNNNLDRKTLEVEVSKAGFTLIEYREEIRRQIIEGKWLMARAAGKVDRKTTPDAASFQVAIEKYREGLLVELRSHAFIEVR